MDLDKDRMIAIAEKMFHNPEPPFKEKFSSKLLQDYLEENDFSIETGIGDLPTSFVATWGNSKPTFGFLAEFDALEGISQKVVPFEDPIETGAPGHGCGHNLLGTAAAGAAVAVKKVMEKESLQGTIKVLGTPAEEICVGKPYMAKAGAFNDLDVAFVWHPEYENSAGYGATYSYDSIKFYFKGESAYGAQPWLAKSALDAVILMEVIVNFLKDHMVDPDARATINSIIKSGEAPSVIPDRAEIWYVHRAMKRSYSEKIHDSLMNAARAAAIATGTEVSTKRITGCHEQIGNKVLSEVMHKHLLDVGAPAFTDKEQEFAKQIQKEYGLPQDGLDTEIKEPYQQKPFYADDRSEVSWFAPMASLALANWPIHVGAHGWGIVAVSGHSIGYKCMMVAADVFARTAVDLLRNPDLVVKAKKEFNERTINQGLVFKSPIPDGQKPPVNG